jgi:hypothetical protein
MHLYIQIFYTTLQWTTNKFNMVIKFWHWWLFSAFFGKIKVITVELWATCAHKMLLYPVRRDVTHTIYLQIKWWRNYLTGNIFLYNSYLPAPIRPQGKSNTPPLKLSAVIRNFWLSIATGREIINCNSGEHFVFLDVF